MSLYNFEAKESSLKKLPRDVPLNGGVEPGTILGGTAPLKFGKAKNVQNLPRFTTIFEFDRKYLWNGWRCRQAVNSIIKHCPFRFVQKKIADFVHKQKSYRGSCWLTQNWQCMHFRTRSGLISTYTKLTVRTFSNNFRFDRTYLRKK